MDRDSVVAFFATTASDGKNYNVEYFDLDMIISVAYRVNSKQATQFRKWATKILRKYLVDGYTIDKNLILNGVCTMMIELLNREQLVLYNKKLKYPLAIAEKDYFLALVIKIIFNSKLSDRLTFKGGTALYHIYLPLQQKN